MEKLLEHLRVIITEAQGLIQEYKAKLVGVEQRENAVANLKDSLTKQDSLLRKREDAITPVENLKKEQATLAEAQADLEHQKAAFHEQKEASEQHYRVMKTQLDNQAEDTLAAQKNVDAQQAKIKETIQKEVDAFIAKFKNQG